MSSLLPVHPAFHDAPQGLLGPGFSRDLLAVLVTLTLVAGTRGALPPASTAIILALLAGVVAILPSAEAQSAVRPA